MQLENQKDPELRALLRQGRPEASLPPRFQQAVWRQIGAEEGESEIGASWLAGLLGFILRPRILGAGAAAVILLSGFAGVLHGTVDARELAKSRYLASVAPPPTH